MVLRLSQMTTIPKKTIVIKLGVTQRMMICRSVSCPIVLMSCKLSLLASNFDGSQLKNERKR